MIRNFKPAYQLYNIFQRNKLKHNIRLFKKYGVNKSYFSSLSSKDFTGIESPLNRYDAVDSADYIHEEKGFDLLSDAYQSALKSWSKKGYAILPKFLSDDEIQVINSDVDDLLSNDTVKLQYNNRKITFAYKKSEAINKVGNSIELKKILGMLMSKEVELFQSINFIKGSEQKTHSDSVHMTTFPKGNLIAVWVALEDINMDNGPLHYYPGSHTLPYIMNSDFDNNGTAFFLGEPGYKGYESHVEKVVSNLDIEKETFLAKKGDILIWHANLLHGGNPMNNDKLTRKSMVFHYYTSDAICFHEITQRPSLK